MYLRTSCDTPVTKYNIVFNRGSSEIPGNGIHLIPSAIGLLFNCDGGISLLLRIVSSATSISISTGENLQVLITCVP